jgi:hypothetical protein
MLGVIVPIVLYPFLSYVEPLRRTYSPSNLERFIWSAAPYLWPAAPIVPGREGDMRDSIVLWAISLLLNAVIYSVVGLLLWHLARLFAKLRTKSRPA